MALHAKINHVLQGLPRPQAKKRKKCIDAKMHETCRNLRTNERSLIMTGINIEVIIYGVIFVAVLVLVEGVYLTVFGKSISLNSRVNRRLEMLEKGANREQVLEQLRKEMTQHLKSQSIPLYSILATKAQKANIAFSPPQIIMLMGGLAVMSYVMLTVGTSASTPIRIAVAIAMGIGGVYIWINNKAKKRLGMIEEQLPDAVELMVRSLRVGHPFSSAINIVAKEVPDPLASEMGVIADEAAYGRDMGESLKSLAERMDMQDLRFLAVAVTIQQQSGGNLAEILDGLSKVIRSRFKLFRRVKAITAEAKWSGMFLSGFPIVALVMINVIQPNYYDDVKDTSVFIPACLVVAAFLVANVFVMRTLVNIKV
jgi:tight adherence protein B